MTVRCLTGRCALPHEPSRVVRGRSSLADPVARLTTGSGATGQLRAGKRVLQSETRPHGRIASNVGVRQACGQCRTEQPRHPPRQCFRPLVADCQSRQRPLSRIRRHSLKSILVTDTCRGRRQSPNCGPTRCLRSWAANRPQEWGQPTTHKDINSTLEMAKQATVRRDHEERSTAG